MKIFIIFLSLLSIIACCKDDNKDNNVVLNNKGEITFLPYIWRYSIDINNKINYAPFIQGNMVFKDKVMIMTTESSEKRFLTLLDSQTGDEIWSWSDFYQPKTEDADMSTFIYFNDKLHWTTGSRHYWIDLVNGSTFNKIRRNSSYSGKLTNLGNQYFVLGQPTDTLADYQTEVVFQGNFETGDLKRILVPKFNGNKIENRIGQVTSVIPFISNSDTLLLTAYQDIFPNFEFVSYLGLYNLSKKEWIYDKVVLNEKSQKGVLYQLMEVSGNKVVMTVGNDIICHDINSGQRKWKRSFNSDFSFSGFEISDGIIVANCEDVKTYGINIESGNIMWTTSGSGTSSNLKNRIMNGVVYFSGGGPNNIFAIDIKTGKVIWKLDPFLYEKDDGSWKGDICVIPAQNGEKAKVVVCSKRYAYCFEAAR